MSLFVSAKLEITMVMAFYVKTFLLLCKPFCHGRRSLAASPGGEYRLKEKFLIGKIEILDRENTNELHNAFEVAPRQQPHYVILSRTAEEKANWRLLLCSTPNPCCNGRWASFCWTKRGNIL